MAWGPDGLLYLASFGQLPHPPGSGAVVAVDQTGTSHTVIDTLTMVIDVSFDQSGNLFILEYSAPPNNPQGIDAYRERTGRLLYQPAAEQEARPLVLLDNLDRPTALLVGADSLWISVSAGEQAPGAGSVVRFELADLVEG